MASFKIRRNSLELRIRSFFLQKSVLEGPNTFGRRDGLWSTATTYLLRQQLQ